MFLGAVPQTDQAGTGGSIIYVVEDNTAPDVAAQTDVLQAFTAEGRPCVYSRSAGQTYDASTGGMTAGATNAWAVQALQEEYSAREIDGTVIQRGDAKFMIPGVSPAPLIDDTLTFAGVVWRIVNVNTLQPQGYPLLHTIQGRR